MSLRDTIKSDQIAALKNRDELKVSVLRLLWSEIKNKEIDTKEPLNDTDVQQVVAKQIKQLKDAKADFDAAGRDDLSANVQNELTLLMTYAPAPLTETELHDIIRAVIETTGANSPKDMGKVMGMVMKQVAGRADGKMIQDLVKKQLAS